MTQDTFLHFGAACSNDTVCENLAHEVDRQVKGANTRCYPNLLREGAPPGTTGGCACRADFMWVGPACDTPSYGSFSSAAVFGAALVIMLVVNVIRASLLWRARQAKALAAYDARGMTLKWAMTANFVFAPTSAV